MTRKLKCSANTSNCSLPFPTATKDKFPKVKISAKSGKRQECSDVRARPTVLSPELWVHTTATKVSCKMHASSTYMLRTLLELICKWTIEYETVPWDHWFHNFCTDLLGIGNNCSANVTTPPPLEPVELPTVIQDILLSLYLLTMASSLLGNIVVLLVLGIKKRARLLSAAYIMSLSASGVLLALLAVPWDIMAIMTSYTTRDNFFSNQMTGDLMCKMLCYFRDLVKFANVLTIAGLTMERYLAVVHPIKARSCQPTLRTVTCLLFIWIFSIILALPSAVLFQWTDVKPELDDPLASLDVAVINSLVHSMASDNSMSWYVCMIQDHTSFIAYNWIKCMVMLVLPTLAMAFSYISIGVKLWTRKRTSTASADSDAGEDMHRRTAKRVTAIMLVTVLLFVISWAPNTIYELLLVQWLIKTSTLTLSIRYFSSWFLLTHTAYNPLLHTFLHDNFRRSFTEVLLCRRKRISPKTDAVPSIGNQGGTYDTSDPRPPSASCSEHPMPSAAFSDNFVVDNCLATSSNNHLHAPSPIPPKAAKSCFLPNY